MSGVGLNLNRGKALVVVVVEDGEDIVDVDGPAVVVEATSGGMGGGKALVALVLENEEDIVDVDKKKVHIFIHFSCFMFGTFI